METQLLKRVVIIKSVLFIILFLPVISLAQELIPTIPELKTIRNEVKQMVSDSIIPSMAIAVIKDGKVIWKEAIGYADIETHKEADENSIYPLGSVSKSITATGIMSLISKKTIALEDNIQDILKPITLKDIDGKSPEIKLWQLISMNGGLNHGYGIFDESRLPLHPKERLKFYEESTIVAFPPGQVYHYSNHAFDISELIIEKVMGKPFQTFMNEKVFNPLGMNSTYAYPYLYPNGSFVTTYTSSLKNRNDKTITYPSGGSGFWSSISDMTNYALFHLGDKSLPSVIDSLNLATMHNFRQGPADLFGIGWFNTNDMLYNNGNVSGGNASISIDKINRVAVICLLNKTSWDGLADQIGGKIRDVFVPPSKEDVFKSWRRIYGTPYTSKYELVGSWKGKVKQPKTNKELEAKLVFDNSKIITLKIGDITVALNDPVYNLLNELETNFKISILGVTQGETRCVMNLKRIGDKFVGYLNYDLNEDDKFYVMPLFIELHKVKIK